ncbi:hypothetical protein CH063_08975 [Colletotrichum higginsianum]|uniref:Uncharacterized protein n=1 Tax=Colletotrichum higginsianum (strain IMI 349063) TaxID=759273 RepID=H1VBW0_COLHI|nr:hypothetical protein CH063_08975 [Colletotrichum higginsianum]
MQFTTILIALLPALAAAQLRSTKYALAGRAHYLPCGRPMASRVAPYSTVKTFALLTARRSLPAVPSASSRATLTDSAPSATTLAFAATSTPASTTKPTIGANGPYSVWAIPITGIVKSRDLRLFFFFFGIFTYCFVLSIAVQRRFLELWLALTCRASRCRGQRLKPLSLLVLQGFNSFL